VVLTVADTGHGIDAQTAARIFEPFFTTKPLGRGTGLGVATVQGIVEQSGGMIAVESAPGAGAAFRVYLPVDTAPEEQRPAEPVKVPPTLRPGTVLLVEDEAPLRKLVATVLSAAGYRIVEAASGEQALAMAAANRSIELVLTDVVMPGLTGPELVARLRESRPDQAVLYMSGYDRDLLDQSTLGPNSGFLPKPFTPRSLLARMDELLGAQRRGAGQGMQR
jgi:two-component system, cell cycle sensor histidine kinase and response regulator CckA